MKLSYNDIESRFELESNYNERMAPKEARFRWNPELKIWWTDDPDRAIKLIDAADEDTKEILEKLRQEKSARLKMSSASAADIDIPHPPGFDYLPYQKAGIRFALNNPSTLIGDEMGLGKTIQAIGVINADPSIRKVLVVCPASLKLNWMRELLKWLVPPKDKHPLTVGIVNKEWTTDSFGRVNISIINYDVLKNHHTSLREWEWDLLILDETHYLKNPKSLRTQQVFGKWAKKEENKISPIRARRKIALTGTPIPNRVIELWPIVHYLDPEKWRSWKFFTNRYCGARMNGYGLDLSGASNLDELQETLRTSIMVRRLKRDVLTELPPKFRQIIPVSGAGITALIAEERRAYDAIQARLIELQTEVELAKVSENDELYKGAVEKLNTEMRVSFTDVSRIRRQTAVAKVPYVVEHIREMLESIDKVVVFAHHKEVVRQLQEAFGSMAVTLVGYTPMKERQLVVDRFQTDPTVKVFIGSIQAAGVGITLTAASNVVFAELDWVPGNVTQAEDRCHRIGQKDNVNVQHIVLEDSIDARMAQTILEKQEVIDRALDGHTELKRIPVLPIPQITRSTRKEIIEESEFITEVQKETIHMGLRYLAGVCDFAESLDGKGFNGVDAPFGHALAEYKTLSDRQAVAGKKLCIKYKRQIVEMFGDDFLQTIKG